MEININSKSFKTKLNNYNNLPITLSNNYDEDILFLIDMADNNLQNDKDFQTTLKRCTKFANEHNTFTFNEIYQMYKTGTGLYGE